MRRTLLILTPLLLLVPASPAAAQFNVGPNFNYYNRPTPGFAPRPALSPYLNLLRGGNPAANYYLGVLPEQDMRAFQLNAAQPVVPTPFALPPQLALPEDPELKTLSPTGHVVGFQAYGGFYNYTTPPRSYFPYNPNAAARPQR